MRLALCLTAASLTLAGCVTTTTAPPVTMSQPAGPQLSPDVAARNFVTVVNRVEPVAERECVARTGGQNCNFTIAVDDRPGQPANAYQSLDANGRPVITFTRALIEDARNPDELAFIMGHESAHHIEAHIPKQQQTALAGALIFGAVAAVGGVGEQGKDTAQRIGATLGSRVFSQDMELEADALGTVIASHAGYDPLIGAQYFARIPDPGNSFLGTHPPNAQRQRVVAEVAAGL
ncbi:M48 family metalloprotease [Actibacterium sp. D379-3]